MAGRGRQAHPAGLSRASAGSPLPPPPHPTGSLQGEFQRKLYKELARNYNPLERPVANDSQPLTVHFSLSLLQIMDVVSPRRPAPAPRPGLRGRGSGRRLWGGGLGRHTLAARAGGQC